jgi:Flp pilus assembly protein TadG
MRPRGRGHEGQAALELALTLPLLLLIVLGIADFGRVFVAAETLTHATREAARYGSLNWSDSAGICNKLQDAAAAATVTVAPANITINYRDGGNENNIVGTSTACGPYVASTPCPRAGTCANPLPGDLLQVQVKQPWNAETLMIQNLLPPSFAINASTTTTIEQ